MEFLEEYLVELLLEQSAKYKEGKKEGIKEGIEEGKREGILNIAKKMIEKGIDIKQVKEITGLSQKELKIITEKV